MLTSHRKQVGNKMNKILYNVLMNIIVFIVGSFISYQIALHLNKLNDYHVNKDMKYFFVIFGVISIILRYAYKEILDDGPSIEDEIIDHMLREANIRFGDELKKESKLVNEFKFLSKNLNYGVTPVIKIPNRTHSIGPR